VILYFYPQDDTPGCTKEACSFRDNIQEFDARAAVVIGVSRDGLESHQRFATKYSLPFTLLSDPDASVSKQYGVYKLRNLYGREGWGIERSTFLIDEQGRIARVWRKVKVDGHTPEVLAALTSP
jgi:peroxiredoxin Q/BCP